MLELELAVVLLCKEVLAAVDGIYKEDLVCSIFMFCSRLDQFETTRALILSIVEALVPHLSCYTYYLKHSYSYPDSSREHVPGQVGQENHSVDS